MTDGGPATAHVPFAQSSSGSSVNKNSIEVPLLGYVKVFQSPPPLSIKHRPTCLYTYILYYTIGKRRKEKKNRTICYTLWRPNVRESERECERKRENKREEKESERESAMKREERVGE